MHHVSLPGSVGDTHKLSRIDIKRPYFIANRENTLQAWVYKARRLVSRLHQSTTTTVSSRCGSIPTGSLECGQTLDLFLKRIPTSIVVVLAFLLGAVV